MATKKKEDVSADVKPETSSKNEVTVTWNGGSRVYSKELHGADFKALAQEFAGKRDGTLA